MREADTTTVSVALDRYLREVAVNKKGKGYYNNKCQAAVIKRNKIGKLNLSHVRGRDVADYRDQRLNEVGANTVRLELALLSHMYTISQQDWGLEGIGNPVRMIRKPSLRGTARDRRLESGEEERLLAACAETGGDIRDIVVFSLETAMRRGELAGLRWEDVNLKKRVAHLEDTKNGERRDVPLSSAARAVLTRQIRQLHDDRVFGINAETITRSFRRVTKRAEIENLRFHDLRHEATSRLFEKGLNPMQVAAITGHKTLQMLKRYTHLRAEDLAKMLG